MGFRDFNTIRQSAIDFIDARLSGIRTEDGEPIIDLVDSIAKEEERFYVIAEYIRRINSIDGWSSVINDSSFKTTLANAIGVSTTSLNASLARTLGVPTDLPSDIEAIIYSDLNKFASSYGKPRHDATFATTTMRLFLSSSAPFTLLKGAVVKTPGTSGVSYGTDDDLINVTPGFDATENSYFVDAGATCRVGGVAGNQIVGAIKAVAQTIAGVVRVTNIVIAEGGLPRETNSDLLNRLQGSFTGSDIFTTNGLTGFLKDQKDVLDAVLVGPGDPLMTRARAGAIDVYLIGTRLVTVRVRTVITNAGERFVFPYQPLRNFNSATNITTPANYQPGVGMQLDLDTAEFAHSAKGNDGIIWDAGTGPQPGDEVEVSFTYNSVIRDNQQQFDSNPDEDIPASSTLLKEAFQRLVVFSMKVVINPGQVQATVEQAVQDVLTATLSTFVSGQLVEYSTMITLASTATVDGIPAVDRIDNFRMGLLGNPLSTDDIAMTKNEYARLYRVDFLSETGS